MNEVATVPKPASEIALRIGLAAPARRRSRFVLWLAGAGAALLLIAVLVFAFTRGAAPVYVTAKAARGDLVVNVSATGTLQPRERVDISAEISGRIDRVAVDFNSRVRKGQVLAELDTEQLLAKLAQSQASLAAAQAGARQFQATLAQTRTETARAEELFRRDAISRQELEARQGDLARAGASLQKANADTALAAAHVASDRTALSKAVIRSPIDGIVLNRQVEPGQSVVASLQAPVLFTLASDLKQMELQVDIDEADIGSVREGQKATFTVDAFPQREFNAELVSVYNAPRTTNGVVTYQGVLLVDNPAGLLRPGLTATADILVARVSDALVVPNGALRFTPDEEIARTAPALARNAGNTGRVWVLRDGVPTPRSVKTGQSDGTLTAIESGEIKPGEDVITDVRTGAGAGGG